MYLLLATGMLTVRWVQPRRGADRERQRGRKSLPLVRHARTYRFREAAGARWRSPQRRIRRELADHRFRWR